MRNFVFSAAALALASCSSSGTNSNAIYFRAVTAPATTPSGTGDCSNALNGLSTTVSNEGLLTDAAIYLAPNNMALLDIGLSGTALLQGTQSGNTYTFKGSVIDVGQTTGEATNQAIVFENDINVVVTVNGGTVTGTESFVGQETCSSGCAGFTGAYDCTSSTSFQGTVVSGIKDLTTLTQPQ